MPANNKVKVKNAARKLFNRDGLLNVRLQHISDEAIVSVGNIGYHFPNKEHIVTALWEDLLEQRKSLLAEFRVVPLFEDMERLLRSVFQLQQKYLFFYIDAPSIIQAFPTIAVSWLENQSWQRATIIMMLHFNVARGVFRSEAHSAYFEKLAELFWLTADGWPSRQRSLGAPENDFQAYRTCIWTLLSTLFTERGWQEYQQLNALINEQIL